VWLTRGDQRLSTHDLCGSGGSFLLLSGGHSDWEHAAAQVSASLGVPIRHVALGHEADHQEGDAAWARLSGIDADGAVLVRPDNHVAWRSPKAPDSLQLALESAMRDILARH
jgi:2,4-dichlorophenol 6-monooxygenase